MTLFSPRILIAFCLATTTACSAGTTGLVVGDGGQPSPTPTTTTTAPTEPPKDKPDAAVPQHDSGPVIDMTQRFDLTLEGAPIAITKVTAKVEPASGNTPARINVGGSYEQQLGHGLTSTATFTVYVDATATGTDACGVAGRSASYLFKDTDGSIRIESTGLQGGSCTMKIASNAADGFSSGSATGVIGGASQKSFTIAWGQPIPKS